MGSTRTRTVAFFGIVVVVVALFVSAVLQQAPEQPPPSLLAEVKFSGGQFMIRNTTGETWREVVLMVNPSGGKYMASVDQVQAGETVRIAALDFATAEGLRFNPYQVKPMVIGIAARINAIPTGAEFSFQ